MESRISVSRLPVPFFCLQIFLSKRLVCRGYRSGDKCCPPILDIRWNADSRHQLLESCPGFGERRRDAKTALAAILQMKSHRLLTDATRADLLPTLASSKDVTDAHLVRLAATHGLKLATLDGNLARKPWAAGVAENGSPRIPDVVGNA